MKFFLKPSAMNQNQPNSLPPKYFDQVYRANRDPWNFETSPYERAKYAATLAVLPRAHYPAALEIGCSLGVLTAQLASRCGQLLALDVSAAALAQAQERGRDLPQVKFQLLRVPEEFPDQLFDLILLSEVGYYWSLADLARAADLIIAGLAPGGQLLLVHWTPPVHDYPLSGDDVHKFFLTKAAAPGPLRHLTGQRAKNYRLDLLEKR